MHWEKSTTPALTRSRPYQGVRVRDPVKELLRRKRSRLTHGTKTATSAADEVARNSLTSSYTQAAFGSDSSSSSSGGSGGGGGSSGTADGGPPCTGGKQPFLGSGASLQSAVTPWSSPEYSQQEPSAQPLAYPATTLTADLYMQTLCPSYTMLTYTHTPLLTNFGTIPVAPAPASFPPMELPDSGLTYLPWTQPLTTISTMPNPGVQFAPVSAALSGPPLVHMPLSMSVTTMIPQLESQGADPQLQTLDLPQRSDLSVEDPALDEDLGIEPGSPNLLDKLLDEPKEDGEVEDKDSYSNSLFISNV